MSMPANNDEDEAKLLAALGSTAASASVYEQSVLRDAKLRSAPQIVLPRSTIATNIASNSITQFSSSSSLVPCGEERPALPDLSTLAPSTASRKTKGVASAADVPHVLKVLSRTRDLLQSTLSVSKASAHGDEDEEKRQREIDLLRMKEQILLGYLTDVAGLEEDDSIIPQQRKVGNGRKRRRSSGISDDYYGNNVRDHDNEVWGEAITKKSAPKKSSTREKKDKNNGGTESSSTNRLDRIKNGEQIDSTAQKRLLKRSTMMQMKSQMRMYSGLTPLKTMEEEHCDAEKSRKRREERRKRRLKRQRAALGIASSSSEDEAQFETKPGKVTGILKKGIQDEADNVNEEKKEDEVNSKGNDDEQSKKSGVRWACTDNEKKSSDETPDSKKRTHTKVFCPICQVILTVDELEEGDSPDEFLAKHITDCQKTSSTRNGGRTLRKRKKPAFVDLDLDDGGGEDDEKESFAPNKSEAADDELKVDYEETPAYKKAPPESIDDIDEFDYEDRVDNWVDRGLERMGEMAERDSSETPPGAVVYEGGLEIPAWVNDRLFPYQRTGVRWMWELHCQGAGGVVGDEMGLGKTVQVSSYLGAMAANRLLDSVLIIAPATMLAHWLSELAVWAPGLRRIMIHRSGETDGVSRVVSRGMLRSLQKWLKNARADRVNEPIDEDDYNDSKDHAFCGTGYAMVTTYESIRRSPDEWFHHNWSYVVLDEGQKIRNPDADVTLSCKRLRTPHRLLLSGTPIQNDLRELWSLFDFVFPGRLGTLPAFEAEFADPIKRGGYSNASPMQVQLAYRCALVLRDLINPYMLRRQKKDVKEVNRMPGKTEQVLFCRLSSNQRSLYEEFIRSDEVMGVMRGSVNLLKAVTVLRKICNHPDLVVGPNGDSMFDDANSSSSDDDFFDQDKLADRSGKLQVLSKILPLWHKQGHKVIIFTQWKKMLTIIEQFAVQKEWKYCRMDGNTNIASRQKLVNKFNTDASIFCMLMTTRTGGVGLNITGANRVLLYDPDWNPQTDAQARERAWRFGQKRDVTVYRLITAGTIEEKIYQRQIFKTALTNQVLQDPKQRRLFSQKDLKDLFTLKADTKNDITETGELTKGGGVVEMRASSDKTTEAETADKKLADNNDTLDAVMKTKGLCGVFDHDFVENASAKKKPMSVVEMEENARKVAMKAALALRESSENQNRFEPTWTGSDETKQFGGASSAGVVSAAGGNKMASSSSLLANLQNKRMQIASSVNPATSGSQTDADKKYSGLLLRIRKYIRRMSSNGGPTTRDVLNEFKDVPDSDAAVFRSMLKSVAVVKSGRWILR
ncbi:hypothetical protein ACHAXR_011990 [Thalassiosira sp. AJA248-18]